MESIFGLIQQVRNHPEFIGGVIFTTEDIPEGKQLPSNWREKWLTDKLAFAGSEFLAHICGEDDPECDPEPPLPTKEP